MLLLDARWLADACSYVLLLQCWQEEGRERPTFGAVLARLEGALSDMEETSL